MKYHRYGHCEGIKFKVGDRVNKGQLIAKNGTGNGQWMAHCHYDILTYKPTAWTEFCIGKSKDWVKAHYADPRGKEKIVMPTFHHLGYGWLQDAQYAGGHAFHPGLDLNGPGSGNADLDDPLHSACDGIVVYVYSGTGRNSGWGDLIVIEEKSIEEKPQIETTPKVDEVVAIPVRVEKDYPLTDDNITNNTPSDELVADAAKEIESMREVKSEVVPVDWNFIISRIIALIKLIFKR